MVECNTQFYGLLTFWVEGAVFHNLNTPAIATTKMANAPYLAKNQWLLGRSWYKMVSSCQKCTGEPVGKSFKSFRMENAILHAI